MKTTIGAFDPKTGQVSATFEYNGVTHTRGVNACMTEAGKYDAKATKTRVGEVASGVAYKIDLGVITNPAEMEEGSGLDT
jgi:hypothetical protein